uniref:Uncharacterized protein n=1 Tax=Cucumis sativus TaxID=3659 RepID=A0A0A0KVE2_CUCSA
MNCINVWKPILVHGIFAYCVCKIKILTFAQIMNHGLINFDIRFITTPMQSRINPFGHIKQPGLTKTFYYQIVSNLIRYNPNVPHHFHQFISIPRSSPLNQMLNSHIESSKIGQTTPQNH